MYHLHQMQRLLPRRLAVSWSGFRRVVPIGFIGGNRRSGISGALGDGWRVLQLLCCLFLLAPMLALALAATQAEPELMRHLMATRLPTYLANTLILMLGTAALATFCGVATAWMISRYRFPLCRWLSWMLVLPAAVPAYIIAYTYTDLLEYAGPVQTALRHSFNWNTATDYWFPDIRSMPGAVLVMASVLYPYVYILARTAFDLTETRLCEAATLAAQPLFRNVALPLARPAIVAGMAVVMMETVSDFGTVDYFALETLTLGIFNIWLGMNSLEAAAQLSMIAFLLITTLLGLEHLARARRQFTTNSKNKTGLPQITLRGAKKYAAALACSTPLVLGFIIPVAVLLLSSLPVYWHASNPVGWAQKSGLLVNTITDTLGLAAIAACLCMAMATLVAVIARYRGTRLNRTAAAAAACGYAFPGTILAIGVLALVKGVDDTANSLILFLLPSQSATHTPLLAGSIAVLLIAYMVRFQAPAWGAVQAGIKRLPPHLMEASRTLGQGFASSLMRVLMPLLRPSMLAGMLLVFVDVMKELPLTLLLRPFDFETLATLTYQFAKDEMLEEAALPALLIVIAGMAPVILLNRAIRR